MATKEINYTDQIASTLREKKNLNRLLVGAVLFLELIIFIGVVLTARVYYCDDTQHFKDIFYVIALSLILIWFGIFVAYLTWAIYFYNINLGLTNQSWAELRQRIAESPELELKEPRVNPHANETLGLPKGTIRGMVAITLLIGGLSMAIASLGYDSELKQDSFFIDHFDFFKTAFLMMIAFYFGNKSLELIGYKSSKVIGANTTQAQSQNATAGSESEVPMSTVSNGASGMKNNLLNDVSGESNIEDSATSPKDQEDFNVDNAQG
ncbi:hypothetical protein [Carboxylicivirga sp. N1Y90]|uniref:hypothetical protein n=1 Tax=Carboxylicivirga fragile TaxID=3417571 RepID=UPI003D34D373|nr:hypothetical protein [Marinilabiliaceae bacterium N1Y90]